ALNGGAGDAFPLRQTGAVDAVVMALADASPERLTGAQTGQNARKSLPEIAPASLALPFPCLQFREAPSQPPAFVPGSPQASVLQPQLGSLTVGTAVFAGISHGDPHLP